MFNCTILLFCLYRPSQKPKHKNLKILTQCWDCKKKRFPKYLDTCLWPFYYLLLKIFPIEKIWFLKFLHISRTFLGSFTSHGVPTAARNSWMLLFVHIPLSLHFRLMQIFIPFTLRVKVYDNCMINWYGCYVNYLLF
jgi:hypothetical protein